MIARVWNPSRLHERNPCGMAHFPGGNFCAGGDVNAATSFLAAGQKGMAMEFCHGSGHYQVPTDGPLHVHGN